MARGRQPEIRHTCRQCANSRDWHNKAVDGHLILCRCGHRQHCQLLDVEQVCKDYKQR